MKIKLQELVAKSKGYGTRRYICPICDGDKAFAYFRNWVAHLIAKHYRRIYGLDLIEVTLTPQELKHIESLPP